MSPSVSVRLLLTQSDARLVAFARAGHERAFEALVQRYRRPLLGYCRRLLLSRERAEDALQQALLQAWLALREGTEVGEAKAWLYRIVHNAALNALRVSGYDYCTLSESLSGAGAPQEDLDRRIAVREALAGLAALPEMQREALLRTAVEGRTHEQVARELGLSENALRGLVYRARAALRAAAGAVMPSSLVSWALASARGTPTAGRLAEIGAGGGSAGIAGLLMKGGAVAVTAGVLGGSIVAVHPHPRTLERPARQGTPRASSAVKPVAVASAQATGRTPTTQEPRHVGPSGVPRSMHRLTGPARQPGEGSHRTRAALLFPAASNGHGPEAPRGRDGGGDRGQGARVLTGSEAGSGGGSVGSFGGLDSKDGGSVANLTSTGGSPASGGSSDGTSSSPISSGSSDGGGSATTETAQSEESPDRQSSTGASPVTGTNNSSKDGQNTTEELTK